MNIKIYTDEETRENYFKKLGYNGFVITNKKEVKKWRKKKAC